MFKIRYLRHDVSDLMTARSAEGVNASVFGYEASLSFCVGQAQHLRVFLEPLDISLGVEEFDETFRSVADDGCLKAVSSLVWSSVGRESDVLPRGYEHAGGLEIVVIVEVILHTLFSFREYMWFVSFSVVDCAHVCRVDVRVERGDRRVRQRELNVQERRNV